MKHPTKIKGNKTDLMKQRNTTNSLFSFDYFYFDVFVFFVKSDI